MIVPQSPPLSIDNVCAVILAGGMGSRMGGVDKGLQILHGKTLTQWALDRINAQSCGAPLRIAINANRHIDVYQEYGHPVWPDAVAGYAGPLAGFHTALQHCNPESQSDASASLPEYVWTVPCDSPLFPLDLLSRLAQALQSGPFDIAVASAPDSETDPQDPGNQTPLPLRAQPVFSLFKTRLLPHLEQFLNAGGRRINAWTHQHAYVEAAFNRSGDNPLAFFNANSLADLDMLQAHSSL